MAYRPDYTVDIEKIAASKGARLPRFVIAILNRILHVDFLNEFFVKGYEGVEFCTKTLDYLDIKLEISGLENVPDEGLFTFASNHPLGGVDGVAMGSIVGQKFDGRVKYLVNDFLMNIKGLAPICVGVNKVGGQSRDLPRLIDEAFRSDSQMIMFPAGKCSRKIDGVIQDIPWTKAFVSKSVATGRSIVPVHFIAQNSPRFYRIAGLCKFFRIKFNLAMLFLPDELYKAQHSTFKVVFGKPIPPEFFDKSKSYAEWAQWLRAEAYKL